MGVPKFFRYISERYPCLSELVKEYHIPEFDNLYLDMNGIIHVCSHPDDDNVHFRITEEQIFRDIFYYIEVLFRMIQPKKLFFMAVDGVAPRAKMNQQRSRRFRTAKDAELAEKKAREKGEELPSENRFDSNCITPGTVFMDRLQKQLQYFIAKKISSDKLWQRPKIILSGHNVPGEGEHKIMDYIRWLRAQPGWDPNTRHCLHGLDADLIMLALCSHEPHFCLLREEVKFGRQTKRKNNVEDINFFLLHLSLMRGYIDLEFQALKKTLPFEYDLERIIDDWVLMGFLVGNDFIPHLPHFHIKNNALHVLYNAYIDVLPTLGGYINDDGDLNLERFEKYLSKLAEIDFENFRELQTDMKYFQMKTGKKFPGTSNGREEFAGNKELAKMIRDTEDFVKCSKDESSDEDTEDGSSEDEFSDVALREEFISHKSDYYKNKLDYEEVDSSVLRDQAECFIRAIQWNLHYYYSGCPSWSWYYPHHYSPYISDVRGFSGLDLKFDPSKPFLPFQQLLAVLPAASKEIVPKPFQSLMTSPDSPIIHFYPTDFETDLNGKQQEWEAVVLIPFIDQESLINAMEPYYKDLSEEECRRNSIQAMEIYEYVTENLGRYDAPEYFPPIVENHASVRRILDVSLRKDQIVRGLVPGAMEGILLGFPLLKYIEFKASVLSNKVKVFEHASRGDNIILKIISSEEVPDLVKTAEQLLEKVVLVKWPHLQKAKISSVSNGKERYYIEKGQMKKTELSKHESMGFTSDMDEINNLHSKRLGIDLGKVHVIVYAHTIEDMKYEFDNQGNASRITSWVKTASPFPLQTLVAETDIIKKDVSLVNAEVKDLKSVFPPGLQVFMLAQPFYGALASVMPGGRKGRVKVEVSVMVEPDLSGIMEISKENEEHYYPGNIAAQRLGIGGYLFSRVTGSIFIQSPNKEDKVNIGLCLKFTKNGEELVGYTRKTGFSWFYSEKCMSLVNDYMRQFPVLFSYLENHTGDDIFFNSDVFPENTEQNVEEIVKWLKAQSYRSAEKRKVGCQLLACKAVEEVERRLEANTEPTKLVTMQIIPGHLYIPRTHLAVAPPDPAARVELVDRIIFIRESHTVPLGLKGTIIGIESNSSEINDEVFDILFDSPVLGGKTLYCKENRVFRLPRQSFIDISHGDKGAQATKTEGSRQSTKAAMDHMNRGQAQNNLETHNGFYGAGPKSQNWRNNNQSQPQQNQWQQTRVASDPNSGVNNVTKFFKNYNSGGGVDSANKFYGGPFPVKPQPQGADSEFQAMWNVLQNQCLPADRMLRPQQPPPQIPPPLETAVNEQTNALRKLLKLCGDDELTPSKEAKNSLRPEHVLQSPQPQPLLSPDSGRIHERNIANLAGLKIKPAKPCGHQSCCSELMKVCHNLGITYPTSTFLLNWVSGANANVLTCRLEFLSGLPEPGVIEGDPAKSREEASESAACKGVNMLLSNSGQNADSSRLTNQLPSPPTQWFQGGGLSPGGAAHPMDNNKRVCPMGGMVPGQVQLHHINVLRQQSTPNRPTPQHNQQQQMSPSIPGPPFNNQQQSAQYQQSRVWRPSSLAVANQQHPSGNQQLTSSTTTHHPPQQQQHQQQSQPQTRRPPGSRARPRIAANFSVPIDQTKK